MLMQSFIFVKYQYHMHLFYMFSFNELGNPFHFWNAISIYATRLDRAECRHEYVFNLSNRGMKHSID